MWSEQEDSMVLDGSFGRTQRISQSEGNPHSTVSLLFFISSITSDLSFHSLPLGCSSDPGLELTMLPIQSFFSPFPYIKSIAKPKPVAAYP
jgi:hypothetical protein